MERNKIIIIAVAIIFIAGLVYWGMSQPEEVVVQEQFVPENEITYYYGQECPHCQEVGEFIDENNIGEKVDFDKKEVWHDGGNNAEFKKVLKTCGIPSEEAGVPFLYAKGECLIGAPDVIDFFKKEAGIE